MNSRFALLILHDMITPPPPLMHNQCPPDLVKWTHSAYCPRTGGSPPLIHVVQCVCRFLLLASPAKGWNLVQYSKAGKHLAFRVLPDVRWRYSLIHPYRKESAAQLQFNYCILVQSVVQSGSVAEPYQWTLCMHVVPGLIPTWAGCSFSSGGCVCSCDGRVLGLGFLVCCHAVDLWNLGILLVQGEDIISAGGGYY